MYPNVPHVTEILQRSFHKRCAEKKLLLKWLTPQKGYFSNDMQTPLNPIFLDDRPDAVEPRYNRFESSFHNI